MKPSPQINLTVKLGSGSQMRDCVCGDVSQRIRQTVNVMEVAFGGNGPGSSIDSQKMQNDLCRKGRTELGPESQGGRTRAEQEG